VIVFISVEPRRAIERRQSSSRNCQGSQTPGADRGPVRLSLQAGSSRLVLGRILEGLVSVLSTILCTNTVSLFGNEDSTGFTVRQSLS